MSEIMDRETHVPRNCSNEITQCYNHNFASLPNKKDQIINVLNQENEAVINQEMVDGKENEPASTTNSSENCESNSMILDGETEIDDIKLASFYASMETTRLKIMSEHPLAHESSDKLVLNKISPPKKFLNSLGENCSFEEDWLQRIESDLSDESEGEQTEIENNDFNEESLESEEECYEDSNFHSKNKKQQKKQSDSNKAALEMYSGTLPESLPLTLDPKTPVIKIGVVTSIVDRIVIIQSNLEQNPLDIGCVVCTEKFQVLGVISDTLGPIKCPYYAVYCNFTENNKVSLNDSVFVVATTASFLIGESRQLPEYLYESFENNQESDYDSEIQNNDKKKSLKHVPRNNVSQNATPHVMNQAFQVNQHSNVTKRKKLNRNSSTKANNNKLFTQNDISKFNVNNITPKRPNYGNNLLSPPTLFKQQKIYYDRAAVSLNIPAYATLSHNQNYNLQNLRSAHLSSQALENTLIDPYDIQHPLQNQYN